MMHGTQSRSKLVRLIAGIFLAAITFGVVTPAYAASGAWTDDARGKPSLYRTTQYYKSAVLSPSRGVGSGKITNIRYRVNLDRPVPGGKQMVVALCPVNMSDYYCQEVTDRVYGTSIQGDTSEFNGWPSNTSFQFAYGILDQRNNPVFPVLTVLKQEVTVSFD